MYRGKNVNISSLIHLFKAQIDISFEIETEAKILITLYQREFTRIFVFIRINYNIPKEFRMSF